jgi:hypothetical protein
VRNWFPRPSYREKTEWITLEDGSQKLAMVYIWDWPGEGEAHMTSTPGKLESFRFTPMNFDRSNIEGLELNYGLFDQDQQQCVDRLFEEAVRRHLSGHRLSQKLMIWVQVLKDVSSQTETSHGHESSTKYLSSLLKRLEDEMYSVACCSQRFAVIQLGQLGQQTMVQNVVWQNLDDDRGDEDTENDFCDHPDLFSNNY